MGWEYLPYTVCYEIFLHLDYKELVAVGSVCPFWYMVSRDERLWKKLFFSYYHIDKTINNRGLSWYSEFRRLHYNIPSIQTEVLCYHYDQVLHVTFSHDGRFFVTCSRDCLVMIWRASHPAKLQDSIDMTVFNWRCAHYSEFNESDTLLLVSGIMAGPDTSTCGEIVVFDVEDFLAPPMDATSNSSPRKGLLKMKCRIDNTPYSLFGTWYNESLLLSGNRFWLGGFVTAALIYMNRASQETSSEHIPITHGLFKFYNTNRSSVTSLLVAKCLRSSELDSPDAEQTSSHFDRSSFKMLDPNEATKEEDILPFHTIVYNARFREYEESVMSFNDDSDNMLDVNCENEDENSIDTDVSTNSDTISESEDKYLIFVTGRNTFIPHEIAIKRIRSFKFPDRIDLGPTLKERQLLLNERKRLLETGVEDVNWNDFDSLAEKFDFPDHIIDMHGHVLGMRLSPDQRFLYVTIRRWPEWENYNFYDVIDPYPSVQDDISLNVIDLVTLEIVGVTSHAANEAYNSDADYYFVYMDVTNELVVSTGEGPIVHIWDRHYGIPLAHLKHGDIVNGAVFNPKDPEMLVSVSDDSMIKIWRSRSKIKEMGLSEKINKRCADESMSDDTDEDECENDN